MKKTMKKILCSLLVVVMCLTSAPLSGFVAFESPEWSFKARAETDYVEGYYTYIITDSVATITSVNTSINGDVIIPSTLGGYEVTAIGDWAFSWCNGITSVVIPNSVIAIGDNVFLFCDNLKNVIVGDSVTTLSKTSFSGCKSLSCITVDVNNQNYSSDKYGVLFNKDKTTIIHYPMGNTRTSYIIPNSVISIGDMVFCKNLVNLTIPNSVISIDNMANFSCENIIVDANNPKYSSNENGVLFNKDKTTLIKYPSGNARKSYIIPESVTTVGYYAFYSSEKLTSVTIPNGVTRISTNAFLDCSSLENITIPNSLTNIEFSVFTGCTNLKSITIPKSVTSIDASFIGCNNLSNIYYTGTEQQWKQISIDGSSSNDALTSATIHYNSTGPSDNPNSGDNLNKVTINFTSDTYEVEADETVTVSATVTCPAGVGNSNLDMVWEVIDPDGTEIVLDGEYSRSETEWACYAEVKGLKEGTYYINLRDNTSTMFDTVKIVVESKGGIVVEPSSPSGGAWIDCDNTTVEYKQNVDFDKRKKFIINGEITNYNEKHTLTDISITIKSPDANKAVFKTDDGYKASVTFPLGKTVETGKSRDFKCTAYIKRGYNPPNGAEDLTFTCILHGKLDGKEVNGIYRTFKVKIKNLSYENPDNKNWTPTTMIGLLDFLFTSRDPKGVRYIDRYPGDGRFNFDRLQLQSQYDSIKAMGAVKSTIELSDELSKRLDVAIKLTELGNISAIKIQDVVLGIGEEALDQVMDAYQDKAMEEFSKYYNKYIKDLLESDVFEHYLKWYSDEVNYINGNSTKVTQRCPIDIFVTDEEGYNVLKIEDSDIKVYDEYASTYLSGDDKILYLPNDIGHNIKTLATDNGEMDYIIESYSKQGEYRIVEYKNIHLTKGKSYTSIVPSDISSKTDVYNPVSEDGKTIKADKDETEHKYGDKDKNCQLCGYDRTQGCSCKCHKNGIAKFFFKLILFFQKIFKTNKICSCGVAHY